MQVFFKQVGLIPNQTVAHSTIGGNAGFISRTIEFAHDYNVYLSVYSNPDRGVESEIRIGVNNELGKRPSPYTYPIYTRHHTPWCDAQHCSISTMDIFSGTRCDADTCLYDSPLTFLTKIGGQWNQGTPPGPFVDVPNTDILMSLDRIPIIHGENAMIEPPMEYNGQVDYIGPVDCMSPEVGITNQLDGYVPSKTNMDINPSPTIISREFQGDLITSLLPYQVDYITATYDLDKRKMLMFDMVNFVAPRTTMQMAEIESLLRWVCGRHGLRSITISKSMDEVLYVSVVHEDMRVEAECISLVLFVMTSQCITEQESASYLL